MAKSRVIETRRLLIMPFEEAHLVDRYVAWLNNLEVVRLSEQRFKKHTLVSCREYMRSFEGTPNYFWAIVSRNPQVGHIGNINAYVDPNNKLADVGILIGEKMHWGKGYGSEAFSAVVDFLFRDVGMRKVAAGTAALNRGMRKIMDRVGMKEDGRRIKHYVIEGREVDLVHSALFREDWEGHLL